MKTNSTKTKKGNKRSGKRAGHRRETTMVVDHTWTKYTHTKNEDQLYKNKERK